MTWDSAKDAGTEATERGGPPVVGLQEVRKEKQTSQSERPGVRWELASNLNLLHRMPKMSINVPIYAQFQRPCIRRHLRINRQRILPVAEIHSHRKQSSALLLRRRIKSSGIKGTVRCQVTSAGLSIENQSVLISPHFIESQSWYRN